MRATNLQHRTRDDVSELRTTIISEALAAPFELWFRVPAQLAHYVDPDVADPLVPALLLPAMKLGEPLELPAPISPRLAHATTRIQTIFRCWEPRLTMVDVGAPRRTPTTVTATATGLFYSGGVDSSYSLTKNLIEHPLNEDVFTHLISIHGLDVRIGDPKGAVYDRMLTDAEIVARRVGKEIVNVATNLQELMRMLGIPWGVLGHGSGLASVGLLLQQMFRTIYVAPNSGSYLSAKPAGSHPLLDPLWSTESLMFVHDGYEATRLERIRMLAAHPIVLDTLHICWNHDTAQYNCGHCAKCLLVMIGLHIAGADGSCPTLPACVDLEALRRVELVIPAEVDWIAELLDALIDDADASALREVLAEVHARGSAYFDRLNRATKTLRRLLPGREKFVLVDGEAIREKLGVGTPFLERDGVFAGHPPDSGTAICELERLRSEGASAIAFWCGEFWYLDHYREFEQRLRRTYRRIWADDSLIVFDLRADLASASARHH